MIGLVAALAWASTVSGDEVGPPVVSSVDGGTLRYVNMTIRGEGKGGGREGMEGDAGSRVGIGASDHRRRCNDTTGRASASAPWSLVVA